MFADHPVTSIRQPPLEYWEGRGGAGVFLEINIFMGKMGEINKWHGGNKYFIHKRRLK